MTGNWFLTWLHVGVSVRDPNVITLSSGIDIALMQSWLQTVYITLHKITDYKNNRCNVLLTWAMLNAYFYNYRKSFLRKERWYF